MITTYPLPWSCTPQKREKLQTLQINFGSYCNLACKHCHIEAGPNRREVMNADTLGKVISWIRTYKPDVVDITGGAPELMNGFRTLVEASSQSGAQVIDRCNLSVLSEAGQEDLVPFLKRHNVQIVASLPCYLKENVEQQRGKGSYDLSIKGLKLLNEFGYGMEESLPLYLVYNPGGPYLPPAKEKLEPAYRERLREDWGIEFTELWCLSNVAIKRFENYLKARGELESYEQLLEDHYNPNTLKGLMCHNTLSVDYRGVLYDCDFNLALDKKLADQDEQFLWDINPDTIRGLPIAMGKHCLACTAGSGSSCTGAVEPHAIKSTTHSDIHSLSH
ncbi:MAG: arsenosugar biosynthesis radical SAM protein ArsS [Planctomycetes bacterium]|nr:arsenosugar biosynthesis radical SAM protein ArsS [Planctomycetota bacterium]